MGEAKKIEKGCTSEFEQVFSSPSSEVFGADDGVVFELSVIVTLAICSTRSAVVSLTALLVRVTFLLKTGISTKTSFLLIGVSSTVRTLFFTLTGECA